MQEYDPEECVFRNERRVEFMYMLQDRQTTHHRAEDDDYYVWHVVDALQDMYRYENVNCDLKV